MNLQSNKIVSSKNQGNFKTQNSVGSKNQGKFKTHKRVGSKNQGRFEFLDQDPGNWVRLHIGPGSLGIPRKPIFTYLWWFFWYFWLNIKVFGQNNLIFELLRQKWCRIIMSFRQNTINVTNWTKSLKSDMSGPAKTCFTKTIYHFL